MIDAPRSSTIGCNYQAQVESKSVAETSLRLLYGLDELGGTEADRSWRCGLTMAENLSHFIDSARQKGMDHATIFLLLRSSGWKEKEIAEALAARELAMSIPQRAGVGDRKSVV